MSLSLLAQATMPASAPTTAAALPTTIGPFVLLLLAIPVLLLGEQLIKRLGWLARSNIPAPIVGGLIIAVALLVLNEVRPGTLAFRDKTTSIPWLWWILPQWGTEPAPATSVDRPLLILFFTCIGLNASWAVAKKGSWQLLWYLILATIFAGVMITVGVITAKLIGESPLLGVMCSGGALMGGFGTAAGFAPEFERFGLSNAATIGVSAAAFGVIGGGLIAGPITGRLIRKYVTFPAGSIGADYAGDGGMIPPAPAVAASDADPAKPVLAACDSGEPLIDDGGFIDDLRNMRRHAGSVLVTLLVLVLCLKLGAFFSLLVVDWVSRFIIWSTAGLSDWSTEWLGWMRVSPTFRLVFPVYMGSMILAAVARNLHDVVGGRFIRSERVDLIASFALAWLLSVVMINLRLVELIHSAGPMLVILVVQALLIAAFSYWVVFRLMGRDYEAAAMSAGMIGFALGATSNAVATMRQLNRRYGPSPRAFLIVTVVGAFLIDFTNAIFITTALNLFKP